MNNRNIGVAVWVGGFPSLINLWPPVTFCLKSRAILPFSHSLLKHECSEVIGKHVQSGNSLEGIHIFIVNSAVAGEPVVCSTPTSPLFSPLANSFTTFR